MSTRVIAFTALGLWGLAILVVAFLFVAGKTEIADDGRTKIILSEAERDFVLMEMRNMLESVQGITAGLAEGDQTAVAEAARAAGQAAEQGVPKSLMLKLPLEFKQLAAPIHATFDTIAQASESGAASEAILQSLADQLSRCTTCHASYRF